MSLFENQMMIFNKLLPNFRPLELMEQDLLYAREKESTREMQFIFKKGEPFSPNKNTSPGNYAGSAFSDEPGLYHAKLIDVKYFFLTV